MPVTGCNRSNSGLMSLTRWCDESASPPVSVSSPTLKSSTIEAGNVVACARNHPRHGDKECGEAAKAASDVARCALAR